MIRPQEQSGLTFCEIIGYLDADTAVIETFDGYHAVNADHLLGIQPSACGCMWIADILKEYIVLDIETTGFIRTRDNVIEIAAIRYRFGEKVAEYHTLVNPERIIPKGITRLTGISNEDVLEAPILSDIADDFINFIGCTPVVGHNVKSFDYSFLSAKIDMPEVLLLDTLYMAKDAFRGFDTYKLSVLKEVFGLHDGVSHRAYDDVECTNALLWACLSPHLYEDKRLAYLEKMEKAKNDN